jgi:hypothetical protein
MLPVQQPTFISQQGKQKHFTGKSLIKLSIPLYYFSSTIDKFYIHFG